MIGDIEGAICDECGSRIGPNGCCLTRRFERDKHSESVAAARRAAFEKAKLAMEQLAYASDDVRERCEAFMTAARVIGDLLREIEEAP